MSGSLMRTALRRSQAQIRHVSPIRPRAARGLVAAVYAQVEQEFGMLAPPVTLHSPAAEPLAACWLMLRETLLASGLAERAAKEAVASAVSAANACPYCVTVHSATLDGLAHRGDAAALAANQIDSVTDPALRGLAAWAHAGTAPERAAMATAPFPADHAPELIGVCVTFHYLNRMVNVFLGDGPLPPDIPAMVRTTALRLLGRFMARSARDHIQPGAALRLLPDRPLPRDLSWAASNRSVAGAFARASTAIGSAARRSVPEPVRELVMVELAQWNGQPAGLGRAWIDDAVSRLRPAQRPAGRLALLTAVASYQVGQHDIDEFRRHQPEDHVLIELTSWASLAAARRIGGWMQLRQTDPTHPGQNG
jgi:AhpD family alkylhydroperoxidase